MNRTREFIEKIEQIKNTAPKKYHLSQKKIIKSPFSIASARIGKKILETSEKLERLTSLAKKKGLFDDPREQIQELTTIINSDIKELKGEIEMLKKSKQSRNREEEEHSNAILSTLNNNLKTTTSGFSHVLEMRNENLKSQKKERETITGLEPVFRAPDLHRRPNYTLLQNTADAEDSDLIIQMPQQEQSVLHPSHNSLLASRAEAARTIEQTINDLHGIFQQLASLVQEQDQLITRIDTNVTRTSENVEGIQEQLLKYMSNMGGNRWLYFKLFMILIFFVILFTVFFA